MIAARDVATVILAAGSSTRFGRADKIFHPIGGVPMLRRSVETAVAAGIGDIVVVTGASDTDAQAVIVGTGARTVRNMTPYSGMGTSLACGANAISAVTAAILVMLADMPFVQPDTLLAVLGGFAPMEGKDIVAPVFEGRRGHPVLFGRRYFTKLRALTGDDGARLILKANPERVRTVEVDDPGVRQDIDTPDDLPPAG